MNTRLQQFLTMEGMTPARFADQMGIQRSGISHLLSGRNKPSFEFLQKIFTVYPNLNPEWLIMGKGKPYLDQQHAVLPVETTEEPIVQQVTPQIEPLQPSENPKFEEPLPTINQKQERKVTKIIIFYSDGSFEER